MHDLYDAWKFHLIFFYRFRFTRFWHMNHTASQKPDLCSIGLGHSFALSLRKTSDKRCNSNCNKQNENAHIMCKMCTKFWRIWFPSGIYIGFIEGDIFDHIFIWSVHLMWPRRACVSSSQPFAEPSPGISSRTQLSAFDATTWRFDSSNIIFSLAARSWKASPSSELSSVKTSNPGTLWSFKENMSKYLIFSAFFFAWVQLSGFCWVLCSFLTKLLEINLAFFFHGLEIMKPRPDRERPVFSVNKSPFAMYLLGFLFTLFFPSMSQKP